MNIDAATVKVLRDRTGAGFMDCKRALVESNGDLDAATDYLQIKKLASADKKGLRVAAEGLIVSYIHAGGRIGVILEVNSETDFVARNEDFQEFTRDIAMHIAAANPLVVHSNELDPAIVAKQEEIFKAQAIEEGKPEHIAANMVAGRIKKWKAESCLLDQNFVKDTERTVAQVQTDMTAKIGEKISIRRFVRFELGDGIEKVHSDFAAEVAQQAGLA